jgi:TetR/AcrR family tetracycline transcriptional repressor
VATTVAAAVPKRAEAVQHVQSGQGAEGGRGAADREGAPRGRGRPARLSAERIVEAAVELLRGEPAVSLTVKRVADAVGAAPMALYRYFPDRETLLQAAADHVLNTTEEIRVPPGPWQDRLRAWMRAGQERVEPYPQLLPYMVATEQPAWLPALARLTEILSPLDLEPEDQALAVTLVGSAVIGYAAYESHRLPAERALHRLERALATRPAAEGDAVRPLLSCLPAAYRRLHDQIIEQTVTTIAGLGRSVEP